MSLNRIKVDYTFLRGCAKTPILLSSAISVNPVYFLSQCINEL